MPEEQSQNLTLHLYELINNAHWEYFFFDENCSYHLLKAIEAVTPEHDLTGTLNTWVIPIDTIKVLINAGIVQSWTFRPSLHSRIKRSYDSLSPEQRTDFHVSLKGNKVVTNDVAVLDTAILYMNYNKHSAQGAIGDNAAALTKELLRKRAQSGIANPTPAKPNPYPPHDKPGTFRYGLGFEHSQSSAWLTATIRPAVHEYLSGTDPSSSNLEVVFLAPSLRYGISEKYLDLDQMILISTANFRQTNPVGFSPAWRILADIASEDDPEACRNCKSVRFLPAIGAAAEAFAGTLQGALLATLHAEYSTNFLDNHRLGAGALLQILYHFEAVKIVAKAEKWWDYRKSTIQTMHLHLTIPTAKDQEIWISTQHDIKELDSFGLTYSVYK